MKLHPGASLALTAIAISFVCPLPCDAFAFQSVKSMGKTTCMASPCAQQQRTLGGKSSSLFVTRSKDDAMVDEVLCPSLATFAMIGLPFLSAIFPFLLHTARSLPANSSEQLLVVTALFVGNRAYLYAMATTIVALAALRGANDELGLGKRVTDLTEELLYRPDLTKISSNQEPATGADETSVVPEPKETPQMIQQLRQSGLEESLDGVSSETQALVLPLLVSFLLAASIFFLPFWNGGIDSSTTLQTPNILQDLLAECLPLVTQIWNAGILAVFSKAELRRLGSEFGVQETPAAVEWGLAAGITAVACFTPLWPAQNFVNMSLAILVSRMIQLDLFPAIVAALSLLTLYDVTSVFLIPAAGAAEVLTMNGAATTSDALIGSSDLLLTAAGDSAMGSVAIQKLTSGTFQPGLLVTKIDQNNLGGALGLGDAVFPSILATFVRRFDLDANNEQDSNRLPLFAVAMGGYLVGCTACEFAPMISTLGLPALVFIIPFMLGSVLAAATVTGELGALWDYNPKGEA